MDLFDRVGDAARPLAERLRPKRLEDFVGQKHLLAPAPPPAIAGGGDGVDPPVPAGAAV